MKWYKKQLDQIMKTKINDDSKKRMPERKFSKPKKTIDAGLEKRSRPKTDSK